MSETCNLAIKHLLSEVYEFKGELARQGNGGRKKGNGKGEEKQALVDDGKYLCQRVASE